MLALPARARPHKPDAAFLTDHLPEPHCAAPFVAFPARTQLIRANFYPHLMVINHLTFAVGITFKCIRHVLTLADLSGEVDL